VEVLGAQVSYSGEEWTLGLQQLDFTVNYDEQEIRQTLLCDFHRSIRGDDEILVRHLIQCATVLGGNLYGRAPSIEDLSLMVVKQNHPQNHINRWYKPFPNGWVIIVLPTLETDGSQIV